MKFLLKYIAVALVASVATYFGAPYLKPYLPAPADTQPTPEAEPSIPSEPSTALDSARQPSIAIETPPAIEQSPAIDSIRQHSTAFENPAPDSAEPAPAASTDRFPQSSDSISAWGITVRDAEVTLPGGRKSRVYAGTLVEETATTGEGDSEASVCQVWNNGAWAGPARIAMTDLFRVPGTRSDVADEVVELLRRFYRVKSELAEMKKQSADPDRALIDANPFAEEYRRLYREQQAFEAKAKELTEERDNSTGTKRMKAADQLRAMLHERQALDKKIAEIDKKYKAWKKAHANDPQFAKTEDGDPRLDALQSEFDELATKVAPFGAR